MPHSEKLFDARKEELFFYSPYSFLRSLPRESLFSKTVKEKLEEKIRKGKITLHPFSLKSHDFYFLTEYLKWDSEYFQVPSYRLHTVLFEAGGIPFLQEAVSLFTRSFFQEAPMYCFAEIPSEDIRVLQALTGNGFRLIETRLTYFLPLEKYSYERFPVREARLEDIPNLRRVAMEMRNPFDRFHADPVFKETLADQFLATYIEESVKGFADVTLVPEKDESAPDAFLTANFLKDEWPLIGAKVSKMVLSAVSSSTRKGWYKKLISEMAYLLKSQGAEFAFMHPASTNKAVIHSYETLGCKLGQVHHVLSLSR